MKKSLLILLLIIITLPIITSCAPVLPIDECVAGKTFGFWGGLWHGFIAPFSFIISLFKDNVAIYAVNNTGMWYDCGYILGVGILFGSGGRSAKRN